MIITHLIKMGISFGAREWFSIGLPLPADIMGIMGGKEMKKVIIIGSGIGGLVAGNLLAQKGHQVTIFEAHHAPGGYTAGFYRQGYYFESGTLSFEASASVFKAMRDIGVLEKIDFARMRLRFISEYFDGAPASFNDFKKMIYAGFPAEKEKLDAFFAALDKIIDVMGNMNEPMPYLYSGLDKYKSMLPYLLNAPKQMKLAREYGDMTASEFAARYFERDSALFQLFSGIMYPDMPAIFVGATLATLFTDVWTVKSGMQAWADILAANFRELGGDLQLNAYVDRIITRNGAAAGVSCRNTVYEADYVIAAADYKQTLLRLLDDKRLVPPALREKISRAAVSEGVCTVYLGLDMTVAALSKHMQCAHVFACDYQPGYDIYNATDGEFFRKTAVSLYSPAMLNPRLAPPGKSSLMLQATVPHRWMNNWGGGDKEAYRQLKEKALEAMIDSASRVIPGLRDYIAYKDAATPLTYARYTYNTDGATSAWSWNPRKKFYDTAYSVHVETPVKNLFIGSCWAMQIGGVPGALAAAYQCADKIK